MSCTIDAPPISDGRQLALSGVQSTPVSKQSVAAVDSSSRKRSQSVLEDGKTEMQARRLFACWNLRWQAGRVVPVLPEAMSNGRRAREHVRSDGVACWASSGIGGDCLFALHAVGNLEPVGIRKQSESSRAPAALDVVVVRQTHVAKKVQPGLGGYIGLVEASRTLRPGTGGERARSSQDVGLRCDQRG